MKKQRFTFFCDDEEIIEFLYSLGKKRSEIINQLIRDCMEDGNGFVSQRVMIETGFSYKKTKNMKNSTIKINSSTKPVAKNKINNLGNKKNFEKKNTEEKEISAVYKEESLPTNSDFVEEKFDEKPNVDTLSDNNIEESNSLNNFANLNKDIIFAGLSAFGL